MGLFAILLRRAVFFALDFLQELQKTFRIRSAGRMSMEMSSVSRISLALRPTVRKSGPPKYTMRICIKMTDTMMNKKAMFLRKFANKLILGVLALNALKTPLKIKSVKNAVKKGS